MVQENGPERVDVKQQLWAQVVASAPADALLLSSSSAITATRQGAELEDASRLLVGHPFNPPHLIPLVEVVPGRAHVLRCGGGDGGASTPPSANVPR